MEQHPAPPVKSTGRPYSASRPAQGSFQNTRPGDRTVTWPRPQWCARIMHMQEHDVVIVGSGIAGGALATVLADDGLRVLALERQLQYRDHVRGEILWPWGVRLARMLGVERVLLGARAQLVPRLDLYDEGASDPLRFEVGEAVGGIEGSLNISHPRACSALADAASSQGADVRKGVRDVRIEIGKRNLVRWTEKDGSGREASCRLIVGA